MAKKQASELPSIESSESEVVTATPAVEPTYTQAGEVEPQAISDGNMSISIPSLRGLVGYCRKRVDMTLNGQQAETLRAVQLGLEKREAALLNGRAVQTPGDAVKWILEQVK